MATRSLPHDRGGTAGTARHDTRDADRLRPDWRQTTSGALIRAAEAAGYAVLLTNDKTIADQRSLRGRDFAVAALPLDRRSALMARVADIADTIRLARPGQHVVIGLDGRRTATRVIDGRTVVDTLPPIPPFVLRP